jgi:hypothetical protein
MTTSRGQNIDQDLFGGRRKAGPEVPIDAPAAAAAVETSAPSDAKESADAAALFGNRRKTLSKLDSERAAAPPKTASERFPSTGRLRKGPSTTSMTGGESSTGTKDSDDDDSLSGDAGENSLDAEAR